MSDAGVALMVVLALGLVVLGAGEIGKDETSAPIALGEMACVEVEG